MKTKLTTFALAVAFAVAALGGAGVLAGDADRGPGQDPADVGMRVLDAHRVAGPSSVTASGRAAKPKPPPKPKKPQLIYLETDPLAIPTGRSGQVVEACPGSAKAINGYYFSKGVGTGFGLVSEGDSPAGLRRWSFYLDNTNATEVPNVTFGMVCIKGVR
jgi:hypothetical protein